MKKLFSRRQLLLGGLIVGLILVALFAYDRPASLPAAATKVAVTNTAVAISAPSPAPIARRFNVASIARPPRQLNAGRVSSNEDKPSVSIVSDRPRFIPVSASGSARTSPADPQLQNTVVSLRDYRKTFRQNPVGNNAEITRVLRGRNAQKIQYLSADAHLNTKGELTDRWDQPIFFHQISGTVMEVRSAGPDQVMWTDDDEILR